MARPWLTVVFLLAFVSSAFSTCTYAGLGFNPWARWNVFSLTDIGASVLPQGADFQGRLAALGDVYLESFSLHNIAQPQAFAWSATAGGDFYLNGGSILNGGVQAAGNIKILSADINGDVKSVSGNVQFGDATHGGHVTGKIRAGLTATASALATVDGGVFSNVGGLSLGVNLAAVAAFFSAESALYKSKANNVVPTFGNDIKVTLGAGVNYMTATATQLKTASRLLLSGSSTGILVINVASGPSVQFDGLDVYVCASGNPCVYPTFGRVLINFHAATALHIPSFSGYLSILAPKADLKYSAGVISGNVIVKNFQGEFAGGNQVNVLPWKAPCPPVPAPSPPPSPGTTGTVPNPPECPGCPWDTLGFNPWVRWNVFAGQDIGTSGAPQGADFQGRFAVVGNGWFKAFSAHDIAPDAASPETPWSASLGGTFSLLGGSIFNGGVEAGGNMVIKSANVDGNIKSVSGNIQLGDAISAATILGSARAGGTISKLGGSFVAGVTLGSQASLDLSVNLPDVYNWFKAISLAYKALPNTAGTIVEYDGHGAATTDPPATDSSLHTLTVTLQAGINVISLTHTQLKYASTLYLKGDANAVLIINVKGAATIPDFNGLDIYVVNGNTALPTWGRVLINTPDTTAMTIAAISGRFSLLAPLASVTWTAGVIEGNVVVKNLYSKASGGGSGQANYLPWTPPCPPCPTTRVDFKTADATVIPGETTAARSRRLAYQRLAQELAYPSKEDQARPPMDFTELSDSNSNSSPAKAWAMATGGAFVGMAIAALIFAAVAFHRKSQQPAEPATPSHTTV